MTPPPEETQWQRKIRERREKEEAEQQEAQNKKRPSHSEFDDDLVPDVDYGDRSAADVEIDNLIDNIGIIDAYTRWIGKSTPKPYGGQTDGIMVSCPMPDHLDRDKGEGRRGFNGDLNIVDNVWICHKCEVGGDVLDLAAIHFGFWMGEEPRKYKEGANFHRLREAIAGDFGYQVQKILGETKIIPPAPPVPDVPVPTVPEVTTVPDELVEPVKQAEDAPDAEVIVLHEDVDDDITYPDLDWRKICPPETFLDEYMRSCCVDDVPEEYHFFHGLIALGLALGRKVYLRDFVPVYGNLFICTLGRTGIGKSKARRHLDRLLDAAMPFDPGPTPPRGVKTIKAPGSAESLVNAFMKPVADPNNPKVVAWYDPIKAVVDFNELSSLISRTNRVGSALKPTLMEFYDMVNSIETSSMGTGLKKAEHPFASAVTTSQPKALNMLIDQTDDASGFLNRWVFVTGPEKTRYAVGGVQVDVSNAVKPLQEIEAWAGTFPNQGEMNWSVEAEECFTEWFHSTCEPLKRASENDLIVRIDLTIKKLALLFAANRHEIYVSKQSVLDALYMAPYLVATYGIPAGQIGNTLQAEIGKAIVDALKKHKARTGRGATIRDLGRAFARKRYSLITVKQILYAMMEMDIVEKEPQAPGPGRPTERWVYVGE